MDARVNTRPSRIEPRIERYAAAWLVAVLAVGLWQGYGAWAWGAVRDAI